MERETRAHLKVYVAVRMLRCLKPSLIPYAYASRPALSIFCNLLRSYALEGNRASVDSLNNGLISSLTPLA